MNHRFLARVGPVCGVLLRGTVVGHPGGGHGGAVLLGPGGQRHEGPVEFLRDVGEPVLHLGWDGRVHGPDQEPVTFEIAQGQRQHALRNAPQGPA